MKTNWSPQLDLSSRCACRESKRDRCFSNDPRAGVCVCVCVRSQSRGTDIISTNFTSALFCAQNQGCTPGQGASAAPCSASKQSRDGRGVCLRANRLGSSQPQEQLSLEMVKDKHATHVARIGEAYGFGTSRKITHKGPVVGMLQSVRIIVDFCDVKYYSVFSCNKAENLPHRERRLRSFVGPSLKLPPRAQQEAVSSAFHFYFTLLKL